jgi:DNA-binding response OmpR family regulator
VIVAEHERDAMIPAGRAPTRQHRLLVVDDELLVAHDLTTALKAAGYDVLGPALNLTQARKLLATEKCDGVLLDASLGADSSEAIALELMASQTPFIVVTGYTRSDLPTALATAPILSKPFQMSQVFAAVRNLLADAS